jgi:light-regulated signal transduction histidine kinase (bacteriophytochrome)
VRLGELIDDLLALSRAGRTELRLETLETVTLVVRALEDLAAAGVDTSTVSVASLPPARADASLLLQVWSNLLSNALKFSRGSAHAAIAVSGRRLDDGGTEFCVRDNGCGFDMQYADKLFGMFQRLHAMQEYEGTGIGLALVKRIVERHGGSVRAEGRLGEGAAFYFALPG